MKLFFYFNLKKIFIVLISISIYNNVYGLRPVAHIVLQKSISLKLPADNIFKIAMDSFPEFAAWGAVGPDISYVPFKILIPKWAYKRKLAMSSNYADMAHYYKSGSFCKKLLELALASNDKKLIAFAAGWITHVAGDFGSHGKFVYPEAGYYLDDHNGQSLHGELERAAESIIFVEKGMRLIDTAFYKKENLDARIIFYKFFDMPFGIFNVAERKRLIKERYNKIPTLLSATFESVYSESFKANVPYFMKQYDQAFGKGIGKLKGFNILKYDSAKKYISFSDREKRLGEAFEYSMKFAIDILANYSETTLFSDKWNLDVGPDANTLVIKTTIGSVKYSGSKNPLYINLYLETLHKQPLQFNIAIMGKVRYRESDQLFSYKYLNQCDYKNDKQYSFIIRKTGKIKDKSIINNIQIMYNGCIIFQTSDLIILNAGSSQSKEYVFNIPIFKEATGL